MHENYVDLPNNTRKRSLRNCSVILNRLEVKLGEQIDLKKVKVEADNNLHMTNIPKIIDDESDFEWPQYDSWSATGSPDRILSQEEPKAEPSKHKKIIKFLPPDLSTPEILALPQEFITIDGVEYKIKKKTYKVKKKALEKLTKKSTANHLEEEEKIAEYFDIKCRICNDGIKFQNFMRFKKHFKRFHPDEKVFLQCRVCDSKAKYVRRFRMLDHIKYHTLNGFKCHICNNNKTYKSLKDHMKFKHLERKEEACMIYICDFCGKTFQNPNTLKKHIELHGEKRFECYICQRRTFTAARLKLHINNRHPMGKPQMLVCEICSKLLKEKSMKAHMIGHQTNERVKCTICEIWLLKTSLKKHMQVHSGDFGGFCTQCNQQFKFLELHIREAHEGRRRKKFSCKECQKEFRDGSKLIEHIAVRHTREFPFPCEFCESKFRILHGRQLHVKRYHPEEYVKKQLLKYKNPEANEMTD